MAALILFGIFAAAVLFYVKLFMSWFQERKRFLKMADRLPGPPALPLVGNALQFSDYGPGLLKYLDEQSQLLVAKGEGAMRLWIGPRLFVMALDGKTLQSLLDSNVELDKDDDYSFISRWIGRGLLTGDGDQKWRSHRKMITPSFHFGVLDNYLVTVNEECRILLRQLATIEEKQPKDVFPFIKRAALDVILRAAMGSSVNAQEDHNHPYVIAVREVAILQYIYIFDVKSKFWPYWVLSGQEAKTKEHIELLHGLTRGVIAKKKAARARGERPELARKSDEVDMRRSSRVAFIDLLLGLAEQGQLTDEQVREEVDTFTFAGHDTTSSAVGWALWCLATHPEIQEKLFQEIYQVFGDSDRDVTSEDLKQMKYLEMCIKETMRVRPTVPIVMRRISHGDFQFGRYLLPKNTGILISPYLIHRNYKIYENVEDFNPDNFLPENIAKRHAYDFVPFSAGPRNCIGQRFAMNESRTMIAWVLRRYHLSADMAFRDLKMTSEVQMLSIASFQIVLNPMHEFPIRFTRRLYQ